MSADSLNYFVNQLVSPLYLELVAYRVVLQIDLTMSAQVALNSLGYMSGSKTK